MRLDHHFKLTRFYVEFVTNIGDYDGVNFVTKTEECMQYAFIEI